MRSAQIAAGCPGISLLAGLKSDALGPAKARDLRQWSVAGLTRMPSGRFLPDFRAGAWRSARPDLFARGA